MYVKILLLNDNPVVTKLVTLSAQKTDDAVDTAHSIDEVTAGKYDLLVIDDALYNEESFTALKEQISFKKSLFVCSRDTENSDEFDATIKKPFLPTDMVEVFTTIKKNLDVVTEEKATDELTEDALLDELELEGLDDLDGLEELDDLESSEEMDDLDLGDLENLEDTQESVLDNDEAQKVKELLEETQDYDIALDLEDEADVVINEDAKEMPELELEDMEMEEEDVDEELEEIPLEEEVDLDLAELELDTSDVVEDVPDAVEEDIEEQIQEAVDELSQEDLESEVDEETLLDIASNEIDSFASLNSHDLKAALGEVNDVNEADEGNVENETVEEEFDDIIEEEPKETNKGVAALQALLKALSDENVAASMKGAKITVNISFED